MMKPTLALVTLVSAMLSSTSFANCMRNDQSEITCGVGECAMDGQGKCTKDQAGEVTCEVSPHGPYHGGGPNFPKSSEPTPTP